MFFEVEISEQEAEVLLAQWKKTKNILLGPHKFRIVAFSWNLFLLSFCSDPLNLS